jgi:hypothetical protein
LADYREKSCDEIPILEEQNWPELWSQMLHSDLDTDIALDTDAAEEGFTISLLDVGNDIETWAEAHCAPPSSQLEAVSDKIDTSLQSLSQNGYLDDSKPVCFGMVRSFYDDRKGIGRLP